MKCYMSDPTDSEELRFCLRKGKDAEAELAKIQKDTEPARCDSEGAGGGYYVLPSVWRGKGHESYLIGDDVASELLDSLAALVADGGPLDQLALESQAQHDALVDAEQCCHYVTHTDLPRDLAGLGQALYFTAGAVLAGYDGARA